MMPPPFDYVKNLVGLGFAVVVAIFLLGQSAGFIPSLIQLHMTEAATAAASAEAFRKVAGRHYNEQENLIARLTTALRIICENQAHDLSSRNNCLNIK